MFSICFLRAFCYVCFCVVISVICSIDIMAVFGFRTMIYFHWTWIIINYVLFYEAKNHVHPFIILCHKSSSNLPFISVGTYILFVTINYRFFLNISLCQTFYGTFFFRMIFFSKALAFKKKTC